MAGARWNWIPAFAGMTALIRRRLQGCVRYQTLRLRLRLRGTLQCRLHQFREFFQKYQFYVCHLRTAAVDSVTDVGFMPN